MKNSGSVSILISILCFGLSVQAGDPSYRSDVVARDLRITGLGWVGHVGMWTGSRVLEVVKDSPIIRDDMRLSAFKDASSYWGSRGYSPSSSISSVIRVGRDQMDFDPEYTSSATYRVGKIKTQRVWNSRRGRYENKETVVPARFRCDTFVYYCFDEAIGVQLANSSILPRIVYNNLPYQR
jgi:hypothetical protein